MVETVSDDDNPMLLHKPKPSQETPDIFGRDIPIDPRLLEQGMTQGKGTAEKIIDRVTGKDGGLSPVVKIFTPSTKGSTDENASDGPRGFGFFIGIKGTF